MECPSRVISVAVLATSFVIAGPTLVVDTGPERVAQTTTAVDDITVLGGTEKDRIGVAWAVNRFNTVGLALPPLVIEFHPTDAGCDSHDGLFRSSSFTIEICTAHRYIVLHELAHAWEHENLSDDIRRRFMDMEGLTTWSDHSVPWKQRGVEAVAEIITWGLYEHDLTANHERKLEKLRAFELITGQKPQRDTTTTGDSVWKPPPQDPVEAEPAWDEVH